MTYHVTHRRLDSSGKKKERAKKIKFPLLYGSSKRGSAIHSLFFFALSLYIPKTSISRNVAILHNGVRCLPPRLRGGSYPPIDRPEVQIPRVLSNFEPHGYLP